MIWGGPVYCDTLKSVQWQRPTTVWCNALEGMSNDAYGAKVLATPDALAAVLADAKFPGTPGAIGMAGFSAFHEFASPFLARVLDRVAYVHLADSCFQGAGATVGKPGYVAYAKLAIAGKVRMTVTSNGNPNEDIHYSGPAGSKYEGVKFDLTSGSKCVKNFTTEALGGPIPEASFPLPAELPYKPAATFRKGELYWLQYPETTTKDPHGIHIKFAPPLINMYGAPWLAGKRGGLLSTNPGPKLVATALGVLLGAFALNRMRQSGRIR